MTKPTSDPWQIEAPWLQHTEPPTMSALGSAVWLWMHDPRHCKEAVRDMEHRLLAPIEAGQYAMARRTTEGGQPLALLLFARFDEQAEARYLANPAARIACRDWRSGDRLWLIDWSAPFGHTEALRLPMKALLAGHEARRLRRKPNQANTARFRCRRAPAGHLTSASASAGA